MTIEERRWNRTTGWSITGRDRAIPDAQFVLLVGPTWAVSGGHAELVARRLYPEAELRTMPTAHDDEDTILVAAKVDLSEALGGAHGPWEAAVA